MIKPVTSEEAIERYCPFVIYPDTRNSSPRRASCLGNKCMLWQSVSIGSEEKGFCGMTKVPTQE